MKKNIFLLLALLVFGVSSAVAAVPSTFNFQGRLVQQDGTPIAASSIEVTVEIYSAATGGTALHTEVIVAPVTDGFYNIVAGTDAGNPMVNIPKTQTLWYQLSYKVNGSTVTQPRVAFNAVPYALGSQYAQDADTAKFAFKADTAKFATTAGTANPIGAAGGDLAGTYPNPKLNEEAIKAYVQKYAPDSDLIGTPVDGDVTGTFPDGILIKKNAVKTLHLFDGAVTLPKLAKPTPNANIFQMIRWNPNGTQEYKWEYVSNSDLFYNGNHTDGMMPYWDAATGFFKDSYILRGDNLTTVQSNFRVTGTSLFEGKVTMNDSLIVQNIKANNIDVNDIVARDVEARNLTVENITISGDILDVVNVNASGYVHAGADMTAGTTITAGTGITSTDGDITATAGNIVAGKNVTATDSVLAKVVQTTGNVNVGDQLNVTGAGTFKATAGYDPATATAANNYMPTATPANTDFVTKGYTDNAINANIVAGKDTLTMVAVDAQGKKTLVNAPIFNDNGKLTVTATDLVAPAINTTAGAATLIGNNTADVTVNAKNAKVTGDVAGTIELVVDASKVTINKDEVIIAPNLKVGKINTLTGDGNLEVGLIGEGQRVDIHGANITIGDETDAVKATQNMIINGKNIQIGVGANDLANAIEIGNVATTKTTLSGLSAIVNTDLSKAGIEYAATSVNGSNPLDPQNPANPFMPNTATNYTLATKGYVNAQVGTNNTSAHRVPYWLISTDPNVKNSWESSIFISPYGVDTSTITPGKARKIPTEITTTGNFYVGPLSPVNTALSAANVDGSVNLTYATFGTDTTGQTFIGNGTAKADLDIKNGDLRINTTNFTVEGATGNTVIAGTAQIKQNTLIGTDGMTYAGTNGTVLLGQATDPVDGPYVGLVAAGADGNLIAATNRELTFISANGMTFDVQGINGLAKYPSATLANGVTPDFNYWMPADEAGVSEVDNTTLITKGYADARFLGDVTDTYLPVYNGTLGKYVNSPISVAAGQDYTSPDHVLVDANVRVTKAAHGFEGQFIDIYNNNTADQVGNTDYARGFFGVAGGADYGKMVLRAGDNGVVNYNDANANGVGIVARADNGILLGKNITTAPAVTTPTTNGAGQDINVIIGTDGNIKAKSFDAKSYDGTNSAIMGITEFDATATPFFELKDGNGGQGIGSFKATATAQTPESFGLVFGDNALANFGAGIGSVTDGSQNVGMLYLGTDVAAADLAAGYKTPASPIKFMVDGSTGDVFSRNSYTVNYDDGKIATNMGISTAGTGLTVRDLTNVDKVVATIGVPATNMGGYLTGPSAGAIVLSDAASLDVSNNPQTTFMVDGGVANATNNPRPKYGAWYPTVNGLVPGSVANPHPYMPTMANETTLATKGYVEYKTTGDVGANTVPVMNDFSNSSDTARYVNSIMTRTATTGDLTIAGNSSLNSATALTVTAATTGTGAKNALAVTGTTTINIAGDATTTIGNTTAGGNVALAAQNLVTVDAADFQVAATAAATAPTFKVHGDNGDVTTQGAIYVQNNTVNNTIVGRSGVSTLAAVGSGFAVTTDLADLQTKTLAAIGTQDGTNGQIMVTNTIGGVAYPSFTVDGEDGYARAHKFQALGSGAKMDGTDAATISSATLGVSGGNTPYLQMVGQNKGIATQMNDKNDATGIAALAFGNNTGAKIGAAIATQSDASSNEYGKLLLGQNMIQTSIATDEGVTIKADGATGTITHTVAKTSANLTNVVNNTAVSPTGVVITVPNNTDDQVRELVILATGKTADLVQYHVNTSGAAVSNKAGSLQIGDLSTAVAGKTPAFIVDGTLATGSVAGSVPEYGASYPGVNAINDAANGLNAWMPRNSDNTTLATKGYVDTKVNMNTGLTAGQMPMADGTGDNYIASPFTVTGTATQTVALSNSAGGTIVNFVNNQGPIYTGNNNDIYTQGTGNIRTGAGNIYTVSGTITSGGLLTAENGLTVSTGTVTVTGTTGSSIDLQGNSTLKVSGNAANTVDFTGVTTAGGVNLGANAVATKTTITGTAQTNVATNGAVYDYVTAQLATLQSQMAPTSATTATTGDDQSVAAGGMFVVTADANDCLDYTGVSAGTVITIVYTATTSTAFLDPKGVTMTPGAVKSYVKIATADGTANWTAL